MGSTLLSPQERPLREPQLLLDGRLPCSPETPQLPFKTGAEPATTRMKQSGPEVLSCPEASLRLQNEGKDHKAVGDSEASMLVCDAPEAQKWPGTVEPSTPFLSPIPSRTRDLGRRQVSGKPDTQESWHPLGKAGVKASDKKSIAHEFSPGIDTPETSPKVPKGGLAKDSGIQSKGPEGEQQPKATEVTVCANNSKVSSTGEKVVLWTR